MSGYQGSCPQCGSQIVFSLGTTLLKVCEHCGTAVARKGANLADYGRVANVLPTPSVLALGLEGRYPGAPEFRLVGRLQLDYGAGTWDEWLMGFGSDSWAWLSESQGKFHYMGQVPLPPLPEFGQLRVGQTVDAGKGGVFVVTEVRQARFMTAAGELPFDTQPGSLLSYADLSGPGGQFGTIDYGAGSSPEALYIGREVTLSEMGLKPVADEDRRAKATAANLSCPQCAGPIEVRAPDQTQRVACPWCGSLLDATKDFAVLQALDRVSVKPVIPLGSKGRLEGVEWQVIGFMERSVTVEGTRYPWQEYLLYEPRKGFHWLVEANGHWSFVQPVGAGDVRRAAGGGVSYKGQAFQHFQSGMARVDHVLGEFYWAVAHGDTAETADYIAPPHMLSREKTAEEVSWSRGTYLQASEIAQAFRLKTVPERKGVAPHQLWPWKSQAWTVYGAGMGLASLVFFGFLALSILGGKRVHTETVAIPQGTVAGTPEAAYYTQPFEVQSHRNMAISVKAPVSNSWLYLSGALINEQTGGVDEFDAEVSYYSGADSDGSWSEGSQDATAYVSSVPPGRYVLRLEPQWEAGKAPPSYEVDVKSGVARFYQAFFAMLAIGFWPLMVAWRHFRFEMQRWAESDHPWVSEGE